MIVLFLALMLALLLLGAAVYLALGVAAVAAFLAHGDSLAGLAQLVMDRLNSGVLIAIPFFVIAATFMQRSSAAEALINAANAWVGAIAGGLGIVCVLATMVFSAISGSSTATAMALGGIMIPAMRDARYPEPFAAGIVGASATLGILIPPSLALIIYGVIAGESIPRLFLAGVVPGLLLGLLFIIWIAAYSRGRLRLNAATTEGTRGGLGFREFARRQWRGLPAALIPLIALGSIYSGIFTVTEAAAATALVAMALCRLFYNDKPVPLLPTLADAMQKTSAILLIVAFAFPFAHAIVVSGVAAQFVALITTLNLSGALFMAALSIVMLALGTVLEVVSVILITLPIVLPALHALGIDPIHYAVVVIINMGIATLTPPIGLSLFVLRSLSTASFVDIVRGAAPFLGLMLLLLALVICFPQLSLWLPEWVYGR